MFIKTPFKAKIDSYQAITIVTTEEVTSIKLDIASEVTELPFTKVEAGYVAQVSQQLNLQQEIFVHINNRYKIVAEISLVTTTTEFDQLNQSSMQLGALYNKDATTFRVWSPVASQIILMINDSPYKMSADGRHYEVTVDGDLEHAEYYYLVTVSGVTNKVIDPYAYNLGLNNSYGIVTDIDKLQTDTEFNANNKDQMVIYETSVCDFTSDINLGLDNPGKFTTFATTGLNHNGYPIGIDHVKNLGVTHIQLMPLYDFGSVDEQVVADNNYNWGYDPSHYNLPEGSYVTNPTGDNRITECQQMIAKIKAQGLGVIIDIVYNHVYDTESFNYNLLVPNYYFRFKSDGSLSNGSFCGNEVASERSMVRRYILDTLTTWVKYYRVDGVRIDLMGLMDIETIAMIEQTMQAINPNFVLYGEGWNLECGLDSSERATQINAKQLPTVGYFNDDFRNFIKGDNSDFSKIGYVQGNRDEDTYQLFANGQTDDDDKTYVSPHQLINYVSCHDDHTLYDYLKYNQSDEDSLTEQIIECYQHIFSVPGIPFIHSGCEFKRTKDGEKNTYNKSRQLNAIKWQQVADNRQIIEAVKQFIIRGKNG